MCYTLFACRMWMSRQVWAHTWLKQNGASAVAAAVAAHKEEKEKKKWKKRKHEEKLQTINFKIKICIYVCVCVCVCVWQWRLDDSSIVVPVVARAGLMNAAARCRAFGVDHQNFKMSP